MKAIQLQEFGGPEVLQIQELPLPKPEDGQVRVKIEAISLDSTIVKVHPDGTGAKKKADRSPSGSPEGDGPPKFIWLPRMLERQ